MQTRAGSAPLAAGDSTVVNLEEDRASRDRALAEWASLLAPIVREVRSLEIGLLPASNAHAEPASQSVGSKPTSTHVAETSGSQTSDTPVNDPGPSRLVLTVTSETLGQIELVIDREQGGVSILIGASVEAQRLISSDKFALVQNLTHGGVAVQSLGIVTREKVGTVLAEGKMPAAKDATHAKGGGHDRAKKRLNLIG